MQASFIAEFQGSDIAIVELGGVRKAISITLVPEAQLGDYVIVHVGHAIGMLDVAIPVLPQVAAACELLGLDPMYIANEGELVAIVAPEAADAVLAAMHAHPLGRSAGRIGYVSADPHRFVQMTTAFGGRRMVDW